MELLRILKNITSSILKEELDNRRFKYYIIVAPGKKNPKILKGFEMENEAHMGVRNFEAKYKKENLFVVPREKLESKNFSPSKDTNWIKLSQDTPKFSGKIGTNLRNPKPITGEKPEKNTDTLPPPEVAKKEKVANSNSARIDQSAYKVYIFSHKNDRIYMGFKSPEAAKEALKKIPAKQNMSLKSREGLMRAGFDPKKSRFWGEFDENGNPK